MKREVIFLSHANPEDNQFTKWIATKLMQQGYKVFCDLIDFKGGEDFWRDAEAAIRSSAVKVIFILSRISNEKQGPLNELRVAANVARDRNFVDFILPVCVDDLSARDANIEIARLNIISAQHNWAAALGTLLDKLRKDSVPRTSIRTAQTSVPQWKDSINLAAEIIDTPELYMSNWFPIVNVPSRMFVHSVTGLGTLRKAVSRLPCAAIADGWKIASFAEASEISAHLPGHFRVTGSTEIPASEFNTVNSQVRPVGMNVDRLTSMLYRESFERLCKVRGLGSCRLANRARCSFFPKGLLNSERVQFKLVNGRSSWKKLTGYKSLMRSNGQNFRRHWHYGIQAKALSQPIPVVSLTAHVVFSDDGRRVWTNTERLHRARRSQCKDWWNDDWRDRLMATMAWLAVDDLITVPLSSTACLEVSAIPVCFESPVTYSDPTKILTEVAMTTVEAV